MKYSLLLAKASMRTIWRTADGMESMLESKTENFRRRSVRLRYDWTGVWGIYAICTNSELLAENTTLGDKGGGPCNGNFFTSPRR